MYLIIDAGGHGVVRASLGELEERFAGIIRETEKKYGVRLEGYSLAEDVERLIRVMRRYGLKRVETDAEGVEVYADRPVPGDAGEELLDIIYDIAWDIDCILSREIVSDVNVVPVSYKIEYEPETNTLRITHETVWDNV